MKKILIVEARYYSHISDLLLVGAIAAIKASNYEYEKITVAGALEIPAAIAMASYKKDYVGYVALGCVIRGKTSHYDIVANESARALVDLSLKNLAIGNAILTVENDRQAIERADPNQKNKGGFAANACIAMVKLKEKFCQ